MTMATILESVSAIVTAAVSWIGDFLTMITENPLILLFVLLPLVGLGIGLLSRLFRVN